RLAIGRCCEARLDVVVVPCRGHGPVASSGVDRLAVVHDVVAADGFEISVTRWSLRQALDDVVAMRRAAHIVGEIIEAMKHRMRATEVRTRAILAHALQRRLLAAAAPTFAAVSALPTVSVRSTRELELVALALTQPLVAVVEVNGAAAAVQVAAATRSTTTSPAAAASTSSITFTSSFPSRAIWIRRITVAPEAAPESRDHEAR